MFTSEEIQILFDALDEWERSPSSDAMMGSMLLAALSPDKTKLESETRELFRDGKEKESTRKEQAIMLKAKLLQMRDRNLVNDELSDILKS